MLLNRLGVTSPWGRHPYHGRGHRALESNSESVRQRLSAASFSSDTEVQIQIQTDEGDTVTLSAQREVDLSLINYGERYRSGSEKSRTQIRASSSAVSSEVQLTVQGDLNDQERADIRALLQKLQPSIDEFLETGQPVEVAPTPGAEYDSLAGFQMDLSSTRQLDLVGARFRSETTVVNQPTTEESSQPAAPSTPSDPPNAILMTAKQTTPEGAPEESIDTITPHALAQVLRRLTEQLQGIA
jgi:hypothetical protein